MTIKHKKTSTAAAPDDATKIGGPDWNDDHVVDAAGMTLTASDAAPAAPAAGSLQLYAQNVAGQPVPAYMMPTGRAVPLQPLLGRGTPLVIWAAQMGAASPTTWGVGYAAAGTTGVRTVSWSGSLYLATPRNGMTSPVDTGNAAWASKAPVCARGSATVFGGFRVIARWGSADGVAVPNARSFAGVSGSGAISGNPTLQTNICGVGSDSGDTTLSLYVNDGAGAATKIPLGANFPDHTTETDLYELALYCPRDGSYISAEITRLNTGHVYRTKLTTNLPDVGAGLYFVAMRNSNGTTNQVTVDIASLYVEQDY